MAGPGVYRFDGSVDGRTIAVEYEVRGAGPEVLLLPSFSTVSTRAEMAPLADRLSGFRTVLVDWPGFGSGPQQRLVQTPALHAAFLDAFVGTVLSAGAAVVAAGHAAGYALGAAHRWRRIVLVAPTWRGPLPTMMGGRRPMQERVRQVIDTPVLGAALYALNTARPVIGAMYRRHVYAQAARVTPALLAAKAAIARRRNGRFGSGAFVTGGLDPVADRAGFMRLLSPPPAPTLIVFGGVTPAKSRAEMEAMAALSSVAVVRLADGALGVHEEFADAVADAVRAFL